MAPPKRNQRLLNLVIIGLLAVAGIALMLKALADNKQFFRNPSQIIAMPYEPGSNLYRVGGLVTKIIKREPKTLSVTFALIDFENADPAVPELIVRYQGVIPDLFRQGQGIVVTGRKNMDGEFSAVKMLAKHDENYMPKMPDN